MAKRSPRTKQPQPDPAPAKKPPPITVKIQPLPPDAARRAKKFYEDQREIEKGIWRSIYG